MALQMRPNAVFFANELFLWNQPMPVFVDELPLWNQPMLHRLVVVLHAGRADAAVADVHNLLLGEVARLVALSVTQGDHLLKISERLGLIVERSQHVRLPALHVVLGVR